MARILAAVLSVNLIAGALGLIAVWWRSRDPSVVDVAALGQTSDPALQELLRSDAAQAGINWWLIVITATAVLSLAWLIIAYLRKPATPEQARSATVSWWVMLLISLVVALIAGFLTYRNANVAADWRITLVIAGMIAAPLVYWISTAFGVKASMTPSVPLANFVRR